MATATNQRPQPKFALGHIVATPGALAALEKAQQSPQEFLDRHAVCDWGDIVEEDKQENEWSLENGFRLFSAYHTSDGTKIYVITEHDRSATTILLPADY